MSFRHCSICFLSRTNGSSTMFRFAQFYRNVDDENNNKCIIVSNCNTMLSKLESDNQVKNQEKQVKTISHGEMFVNHTHNIKQMCECVWIYAVFLYRFSLIGEKTIAIDIYRFAWPSGCSLHFRVFCLSNGCGTGELKLVDSVANVLVSAVSFRILASIGDACNSGSFA